MQKPDNIFLEEALELISNLEALILNILKQIKISGPVDSREPIHRLFRDFHTLKGVGAMAGFPDLVPLVHAVESVLERIRDKGSTVDRCLMALLLEALDLTRNIIEQQTPDPAELEKIIHALTHMTAEDDCKHPKDGESIIYRIKIEMPGKSFSPHTNPESILESLQVLGRYTLLVRPDRTYPGNTQTAAAGSLVWEASLETREDTESIKKIFAFLSRHAEIHIDIISGNNALV